MRAQSNHMIIPWPARLAVAVGCGLLALVMVSTASAQTGVTGNYCVQDYRAGANCEAEDVRIGTITPALSEVCLLPGDTAQVEFTLQLITGATTRYDIGLFIATQGGSALSGDSCYHDYLNPGSTTTFNPNGGPFRNDDGDTCADTRSADGPVYYTTELVTITCVDNNNDGVVDDISTCTSWDNNANSTCNDVSQAFPGTNPKCKCEDRPTNTILYQGLDWGDLPSPYPTLNTNSGPYHAVQRDTNNDGKPDTSPTSPNVTPAVWLGANIDLEGDGIQSSGAVGDDNNNLDDEDGVTPTLNSWTVGNPGNASVTVVVSTSTGPCTGCKLAWWIDWNNDGDFTDTGENYSAAVVAGSNPLNFAVPSSVLNFNFSAYSRWRLYSPEAVTAYPTPASTNLVTNGEVEDYLWDLQPLAVTLASFSAMCTAGQPEISWETVSELNTLGFNVWRNTSNSGPQDKLNASLIPAHPGSPQGYMYTFVDTTAVANTTYYYWLEDISTGNVSSFNGPIEIQCQTPTSVGFDTVDANPAAGAALPAAGLLAVGAAGAAAVWLRRRRA